MRLTISTSSSVELVKFCASSSEDDCTTSRRLELSEGWVGWDDDYGKARRNFSDS